MSRLPSTETIINLKTVLSCEEVDFQQWEHTNGKSVEDVISDVCLRKDGRELEDWRQGFKDTIKTLLWNLSWIPDVRCFYQRHLDALDKKFIELVENNSHLVRNTEDLKLIQTMLSGRFSNWYFEARALIGWYDQWTSQVDLNIIFSYCKTPISKGKMVFHQFLE